MTLSADVSETLAEYSVAGGVVDNFLSILLARVEDRYALPRFAEAFRTDFETFLQSADADPATAGVQPYRNPSGSPILSLAATHWFGPAETWPRELENHPYIEFWHRLDAALEAAAVPDLGPQLLGDTEWWALFSSGALAENPGIRMTVSTQPRMTVRPLDTDQLAQLRAANTPADVGAVKAP